MTAHEIEKRRGPSAEVAAELRAQIARQGRNQAWLARTMRVPQAWVSRRISPTADVDMTLEDVWRMAEALNVSVKGLLQYTTTDLNREPAGSTYSRSHLRLVGSEVAA